MISEVIIRIHEEAPNCILFPHDEDACWGYIAKFEVRLIFRGWGSNNP